MKYKNKVKEKEEFILHKTRKEQLKDILKNDFSLLVDISLLDLLFSLPLYLLFFLQFKFLLALEELTFNKAFPIVFYLGLVAIILFALKGLAKGASYALLQKRIFNEGFIIIPTFFKQIKYNFTSYFFSYLILGFSYFLTSSLILYFIYLNANSFVKGLGIGVLLLGFLICYISTQYFLNLTNVYELSFFQGMKNAYSFTLISFLASILFFIFIVLLPFYLFTLSYVVIGIAIGIYILFYNGFSMLVFSLYSVFKFDTYINKENFPSYYKRGLLKEDK